MEKQNKTAGFIIKLLLILFTMMAGGCIYGQQASGHTPEQRASELTQWMKTNLDLSEAQVAQVKGINLKCAEKNAEIQHASSGKRQKMQALKNNEQARDTELKNVLTPEQFKTWQSKKSEFKSKAKEKAKQKKASNGTILSQ